MKTTKQLGNFLHDNGIYALFDGKTNGDEYKVCVKEVEHIYGTPYWVFGRVYKVTEDDFYFDQQGCKSFPFKDDAIKEACEFFGVKNDFFGCK